MIINVNKVRFPLQINVMNSVLVWVKTCITTHFKQCLIFIKETKLVRVKTIFSKKFTRSIGGVFFRQPLTDSQCVGHRTTKDERNTTTDDASTIEAETSCTSFNRIHYGSTDLNSNFINWGIRFVSLLDC